MSLEGTEDSWVVFADNLNEIYGIGEGILTDSVRGQVVSDME